MHTALSILNNIKSNSKTFHKGLSNFQNYIERQSDLEGKICLFGFCLFFFFFLFYPDCPEKKKQRNKETKKPNLTKHKCNPLKPEAAEARCFLHFPSSFTFSFSLAEISYAQIGFEHTLCSVAGTPPAG